MNFLMNLWKNSKLNSIYMSENIQICFCTRILYFRIKAYLFQVQHRPNKTPCRIQSTKSFLPIHSQGHRREHGGHGQVRGKGVHCRQRRFQVRKDQGQLHPVGGVVQQV